MLVRKIYIVCTGHAVVITKCASVVAQKQSCLKVEEDVIQGSLFLFDAKTFKERCSDSEKPATRWQMEGSSSVRLAGTLISVHWRTCSILRCFDITELTP